MRHLFAVLLTLCLGQLAFGKEKKEVKNFQVGLTLKQYEYLEPSIDVEHRGLLYGLWGEWLWGSALGNGRTTGDLVFGTIDYSGGYYEAGNFFPADSTTFDVITKVSTRFEYKVAPSANIFAGLGGRYYYDLGKESYFYRRMGTYVFIPVGGFVELDTEMGKLTFDLQYDFVVYGNIQSKLSDAGPFPDITQTQSGYGLSFAAGWQNDDYSGALFYEKWFLNESNVVSTTSGDFVEPENWSNVIGLKLGYKF